MRVCMGNKEINELKAVKVINKLSILLPGVVVFVFTKFKHNLSTFTFSIFFFALSGKFPAVGSLELSNPPGWGQKKRAMPCPSSTLQHFLPITLSNSVILSIWGSLVKFQEGGIVLKTMLCARVQICRVFAPGLPRLSKLSVSLKLTDLCVQLGVMISSILHMYRCITC